MTEESPELLGGDSRVSCGINGRPLAEPPIFDYSDLIDEEYDKKHKALMAYTKGDIVRTTEMMDQYLETQVLLTYLGWAGGMVDQAVRLHHESEGFYNSLKEDVKYDTIEASKPGLLSLIAFRKQNDGSYVADTFREAQARTVKYLRRTEEDIRSLGKEQAGNQTDMGEGRTEEDIRSLGKEQAGIQTDMGEAQAENEGPIGNYNEQRATLVEAVRGLKEDLARTEDDIGNLSKRHARNEEEMMMSEGIQAKIRESVKRLKEAQLLDGEAERSTREMQAKNEERAKLWRGAQASMEEALRNVKEKQALITEARRKIEEKIRQLPFGVPESELEDMANMLMSTSDSTTNKAESQPTDFEDVLEPTTLSQLALSEQPIVTPNQGDRQPLPTSTLQAIEFKHLLVLLLLILASGLEAFLFKCWLFIMKMCRLLDEWGRKED